MTPLLGLLALAGCDAAGSSTMLPHLGTPSSATAIVSPGDVLLLRGDPPRAAAAFREALARDPDQPDALRGLGVALLRQGMAAAATPYLKAAAERGEAGAWLPLGVAYDRQALHEEAQDAYLAGLDARPDDADLLTNLALSKALTAEFEESIPLLRQVASGPRADTRQRRDLVLVLALSGDAEAARDAGRTVLLSDAEVEGVLGLARAAIDAPTPEERAELAAPPPI